jgi:2-polyprenyl-6-methoxyphenol hydroxylase-like FAD-dependent oxidoreductase
MAAKTDVMVAGAGPVGLAMASELARYGLTVRIVDKSAARTDKSKALVVWSRTMELMDRMGCTEKFIAAGLKAEGANVFSGRETIAHVDMSAVESPYPFVLMIPQSETERLLEEHLATFGVKVERRTELTAFEDHVDSVSSTLLHADGREEKTDAAWLIGCDGAHSTVRHGLGMEFHGDTLPTDFVLADVRVSGVSGPPAIDIYWHADGVLALFPMPGHRFRIIADVGESAGAAGDGHRADPAMPEIQAILDRRAGGGLEASDPAWLTSFSINERKVLDYSAGRVFLAGDAAHIHSPAGGQGMNTGIHDACNLAWKLALVERGICKDEPLLSSYSTERSAIAKLVLEATGKATAVAVMKGGVAQSIRNLVASVVMGFSPVQRKMADLLSEVAVAYPASPLNAESAHVHDGPRAGDRAPIRADEPAVGAGSTPKFAAFSEDGEAARVILARYPEFAEAAPRPPYVHGGLWLVRPDGYVALAAKSGAWSEVDAYLAKLAAGPGVAAA